MNTYKSSSSRQMAFRKRNSPLSSGLVAKIGRKLINGKDLMVYFTESSIDHKPYIK